MKDDDELSAKLAEYNARRARIDRDTEFEPSRLTIMKRLDSTPRRAR